MSMEMPRPNKKEKTTANQHWTNSGKMGLGFDMPLFGMGLVFGITLAHFWVDQFLWRMKDNERAAWIKQRYSFLFHS